ncbi:ABC transporter permease [Xylanimonas ulmi]|uniref:ABC-2 type transport system permease protein n=1 Tax=Xylanimonas ulmi TaxID=228973 RepID=A0A4Q7M597_9MICO|nr:ABC transporter permease [Xylanibacterium ulmi]RZS61189.1 ABC-2 type transport system permease protein [Xylanibacterium ulmi]
MSASTAPPTARPAGPARRPARARVTSLARAELLLLLRNRTALFNALLLPVMTVVIFGSIALANDPDAGARAALGARLLPMLLAYALMFVVYYNLTTTLVARREDLVLKRLLTGESSPGEVLAATAAPAVAIVLAQGALGAIAVVAMFGTPPLTNPLLALVALAGGMALFALLAAASAGLTKSVESAQLTTLPILVGALALSGTVAPLSASPEAMERIGRLTPLQPVFELMRLGVAGTGDDGAALTFAETFQAAGFPAAVLAVWLVAAAFAARRWMRWQPRR